MPSAWTEGRTIEDLAAEVARLSGIVSALREHCPWTRAQDHRTLLGYLVEEAYEAVDAIEQGRSAEELRGELADVLFQVVLHAQIAEENGDFDLQSVLHELSEKLIRRSPHVFAPDGTLRVDADAALAQVDAEWQRVKREENPVRGAFEGIPAALPALMLAQKTLRRAGAPASGRISPDQLSAEELGEQLLDLLRQAPGVDAEQALRAAVYRLQARAEEEQQSRAADDSGDSLG
ncbi:nucleotide pyrophosphohydrolase [Acaricomes phytoseiuli]|uniref:MazG nucleotide pyrophosphohydrolase domain-containing protein n=1 Tax=Acaricomes phytoseiuli TaxID=291968 RepID=UPI000363B80E|nr:MazG nucleotide pyrophosphohydrolase domain-containing protein [Acaricomes phytoseiuli]MCW1250428.1 nucleotide pyrophosphohydrolase [Acaricomes phytoseiuli]